MLTDYIPQKQGLRQHISVRHLVFVRLTDYIPQKQGLRHYTQSKVSASGMLHLTDYIPQKQGLRHQLASF